MTLSPTLSYARTHRARFLSELKEFLRFPSVSSQQGEAQAMKACARWLAAHLRQIGMQQVQVVPTRGHPIVCAAWHRYAGRPTVLIYGHYDVLPGEPLSEWKTAPFEPMVSQNRLYGRGSSDDKGQLFAHIKALESYLKTSHSLPVNVKCVFEGEEEIGSPHLTSFVERNKRALRADVAVISDTRMLAPGRPAISYAQRGGLRAELVVEGPHQDLHSGNFGGAIHNPLQALCEMIAGLHDALGRVTIPGFYEDVLQLNETERASMARNGPSDEQILREANVERGWGELGFSLYERTTARPALTMNGITGGHQGAGAKSIIPAKAIAKLSFRLVPNQDPHRVARLFQEHIQRITPRTVRSFVRTFSAIEPAIVDRHHVAMRAAMSAYEKGFGARPAFVRSGGSIPVVNTFQEILGVPAVLMGFGLPGDRIHAPNESFYLPNFYQGIATSIWYLALMAKLRSSQTTQSYATTQSM